jgi:hypothetical protein
MTSTSSTYDHLRCYFVILNLILHQVHSNASNPEGQLLASALALSLYTTAFESTFDISANGDNIVDIDLDP